MKSAYPKIFEPITIKRTTIKNRIAMTPMGTNYGETSGEMSNRHKASGKRCTEGEPPQA